MGTRHDFGAGTFCWANLSSPDPPAARSFYTDLLGWDYDERAGDDGTFAMARRHDANVAAIYEREPEEREQGLPPHWNNYVSVDDADASAARAAELGGEVFQAPFDVSDAGRTAVLLDPTGAMFWVWQPRTHIGAGRVNEPGCLTWNELTTHDVPAALEFYAALFGWEFEAVSNDESDYWVIRNETASNRRNGGIRATAGSDPRSVMAPIWIPYFTVDDPRSITDASPSADSRAELVPGPSGTRPTTATADPTGAVFGLVSGEGDP